VDVALVPGALVTRPTRTALAIGFDVIVVATCCFIAGQLHDGFWFGLALGVAAARAVLGVLSVHGAMTDMAEQHRDAIDALHRQNRRVNNVVNIADARRPS
jgi:hypothetical protein